MGVTYEIRCLFQVNGLQRICVIRYLLCFSMSKGYLTNLFTSVTYLSHCYSSDLGSLDAGVTLFHIVTAMTLDAILRKEHLWNCRVLQRFQSYNLLVL
jgi:hypothetical protein